MRKERSVCLKSCGDERCIMLYLWGIPPYFFPLRFYYDSGAPPAAGCGLFQSMENRGQEASPSQPEQEPAPEQTPESSPERLEVDQESESSPERTEGAASDVESGDVREVSTEAGVSSVSEAPKKDALRMQVERALEDKLWEIYLSLPKESRQRFKEGGEICATELRRLAERPKVRPRNVLALIKRWLKLIPVVNKWFLWQEAKVKTDKFMRLHKEHQEERSMEIT